MKRIKVITAGAVLLITSSVILSFTSISKKCVESIPIKQQQKVNMFVSHGHCSLPFTGNIENLNLDFGIKRADQGNPLENMELSFEINPNSFFVCRGEDLTNRVKTPGLFINEKNENLVFKSTNVYTMGLDWYQVNGELSIKGVKNEVKFFVSGIRDESEQMAKLLVLEGQFNLHDWGIDYDKILSGVSSEHPTKWMHINMIIDPC